MEVEPISTQDGTGVGKSDDLIPDVVDDSVHDDLIGLEDFFENTQCSIYLFMYYIVTHIMNGYSLNIQNVLSNGCSKVSKDSEKCCGFQVR